MRRLLISQRLGLGWVSHLSNDAPREQKKFMLEYPHFIERLLAGRKLRYTRAGLDAIRDLPAPANDAEGVALWNEADLDAQRDAAVHAFLTDWQRRFPGVQHPNMSAVGSLEVVEVPKGVPVRVVACEGAERIERFDGEWL